MPVGSPEHRHCLICDSSKDHANDPEEYIGEQFAESDFELWKNAAAKANTNRQSSDEAHNIGQPNSHLKSLPVVLRLDSADRLKPNLLSAGGLRLSCSNFN